MSRRHRDDSRSARRQRRNDALFTVTVVVEIAAGLAMVWFLSEMRWNGGWNRWWLLFGAVVVSAHLVGVALDRRLRSRER